MGLIESAVDAATAPLRMVLDGVARGTASVADPLNDIEDIQEHVLRAVDVIKDATEQIEAHVAVIEKLATSLVPLSAAVTELGAQLQALPALTESVAELSAKLDVVADVLEPLVHMEQDVGKVGHLFSRRRQIAPPPEG
jgi:ABC-type transporter Mla subunit MlaD